MTCWMRLQPALGSMQRGQDVLAALAGGLHGFDLGRGQAELGLNLSQRVEHASEGSGGQLAGGREAGIPAQGLGTCLLAGTERVSELAQLTRRYVTLPRDATQNRFGLGMPASCRNPMDRRPRRELGGAARGKAPSLEVRQQLDQHVLQVGVGIVGDESLSVGLVAEPGIPRLR